MFKKINNSKVTFLITQFLISSSLALILFNNSTELNFDYLIQDIFFLEYLNVHVLLRVISSFSIATLVTLVYLLTYDYFYNLQNIKEKVLFTFLVSCFSLFTFLYFFRLFFLSRFYVVIFIILLTIFTTTFDRFAILNVSIVLIIFSINFGLLIYKQTISKEEIVSENVLSIPEYILDEEILYNDYDYLNYVYSDSQLFLNSKVKISNTHIYKYLICCKDLNYAKMKKKSLGYLDSHNKNLIYITGSGFISYLPDPQSDSTILSFKSIPSNFHEIINNKFISTYKDSNTNLNKESTKGMVILNDVIYISYLNETKENCINLEVLKGNFNYEYIKFEPFFQPEECISRDHPLFNSHAAGGKLEVIDNEHLGLTAGDFNIFGLSQNENSIYGKIYSLNINNSKLNLISSGHRNPQGLHKVFNKNILIETEHGPRGGDEINLIYVDKYENYGWPLVSYGTHYSDQYYEDYGAVAPLNQTHEDFGFKEPLKHFPFVEVGPHGISDVEEVNGKKDTFFVATLYGKKIYEIRINFQNETIESFVTHYVGERIRDIEYNSETNKYFILMEDSPGLGILEY